MIWVVAFLMALACFMALFAPTRATSSDSREEARSYLDEIKKVEAALEKDPENSGLKARLIALQKQALSTKQSEMSTGLSRPLTLALTVLFSLSAVAFYGFVGNPALTQKDALQSMERPSETLTLPELTDRLARRLEADPNQPTGWVLYARSLVTLQRYDEARAAYDKALELAPDNENIAAERTSAIQFMESRPAGPTQDQIEAASEMSAEEQQAMITQMVTGLAERLRDNPNDPEGWVRLLRARKVLGQTSEAEAELTLIRETFADQPELIDQILTAGGWAE